MSNFLWNNCENNESAENEKLRECIKCTKIDCFIFVDYDQIPKRLPVFSTKYCSSIFQGVFSVDNNELLFDIIFTIGKHKEWGNIMTKRVGVVFQMFGRWLQEMKKQKKSEATGTNGDTDFPLFSSKMKRKYSMYNNLLKIRTNGKIWKAPKLRYSLAFQ